MQISSARFQNLSTFRKRLPFLTGLAVLFFLSSCESDISNTGKEILPPEDLIEIAFSDTFSLQTELIFDDSVANGFATQQLLGTYLDPQLGTIRASIFTQFEREDDLWDFDLTSSPQARELVQLDSVILGLDLTGAYGRLQDPQFFQVFEIANSVNFPDSSADLTAGTKLDVIEEDLCLTPEDCFVDFREQETVGDIRMRLKPSIGEKILYAPPAFFETSETFEDLIRGIHILPGAELPFFSREPGAIFFANMTNINVSSMDVFYRTRPSIDSAFTEGIAKFNFRFQTPRYHYIERGDDVESSLLGLSQSDPDLRDMYLFIQEGKEIKVFCKFPSISSLQNVGVNKAELILHVDTTTLGSNDRYTLPEVLRVFQIDENRQETDLLMPILGPDLNSALYDSENGRYVFNITSYVQELVINKIENNGFLLSSTNFRQGIDRVILGGPSHPTLRPELNLTLTRRSN